MTHLYDRINQFCQHSPLAWIALAALLVGFGMLFMSIWGGE